LFLGYEISRMDADDPQHIVGGGRGAGIIGDRGWGQNDVVIVWAPGMFFCSSHVFSNKSNIFL
jgi:hypothetical protein